MPRVELAGVTLSYAVAGQGEALVLISGLDGLGKFWRSQIEAFSPTFKTITFDHPEVGRSAGTLPYSIEQWACDHLVGLLDCVGIGVAHLVGHSSGGMIAQVLAADYPAKVASVVLGATWAQPDDRFRRLFELRREVSTASRIEADVCLASIMTTPADEGLASVEREEDDPAIVGARLDAILAYEGLDRLRRIRCPALVIAAADDFFVPARISRILAGGIAGAQLKIPPSGGHAFPRSRAAEYNRLVLGFLLSIAGRQPTPMTDTAPTTVCGEGGRL